MDIKHTASTARGSFLKIAVLSDLHYLSPDLIADTPDYAEYRNSDRKMYEESDAFLKAALKKISREEPDLLFISGDLSKDGELENHYAIASLFRSFSQRTGTLVFAAPGNHDLNNPDALDFRTKDGKAVAAEPTTPEQFWHIYRPQCPLLSRFQPADGKKAGSLSYTVRLKNAFTILVLDTVCCTSDCTRSGRDVRETRGLVSPDLEGWAIGQIREAKKRGDTVIGLAHHGFIPHFSMEAKVMPMYLVEDYRQISEAFADAGLSCIFTGHMHANDIAVMRTSRGNSLYDIETGSLVTYPSPVRIVTITRTAESGVRKELFDIHTHTHLNAGTFIHPLTQKLNFICDMTEYGRSHGFDVRMLQTTALHNLHRLEKSIKKDPGRTSKMLQRYASRITGQLSELFSDRGVEKYGITIAFNRKGMEESLRSILNVFFSLDSKTRDAEILQTVRKLAEIPVNDRSTFALGHRRPKTILDFVNYIYQRHLSGKDSEPLDEWVKETEREIAEGRLTERFVEVLSSCAFFPLQQICDRLTVSDLLGSSGIDRKCRLLPSDGRTPLITLNVLHGRRAAIRLLRWTAPDLMRGRQFDPACTITTLVGNLMSNPLTGRWISEDTLNLQTLSDRLINESMRQKMTNFILDFACSMGCDTSEYDDNDAYLVHYSSMPELHPVLQSLCSVL